MCGHTPGKVAGRQETVKAEMNGLTPGLDRSPPPRWMGGQGGQSLKVFGRTRSFWGLSSPKIEMGVDNMDPFYGAPVVLIVLADKSRPTCVYDGSLVMGNLMLEAEEQGIGSCWIHRAKEEFESEEGKEILKSLGIEGDYEGIGHCILGYADGPAPKAAPRKDSYVYHID